MASARPARARATHTSLSFTGTPILLTRPEASSDHSATTSVVGPSTSDQHSQLGCVEVSGMVAPPAGLLQRTNRRWRWLARSAHPQGLALAARPSAGLTYGADIVVKLAATEPPFHRPT